MLRTPIRTMAVTSPTPLIGWTTQVRPDNASSENWSNVTSDILDNGNTKTLIANPPSGDRLYRLFKPQARAMAHTPARREPNSPCQFVRAA